MTTPAEIGMVTMGVADRADAAPIEDKDVDFHCDNQKSTEFWCRRPGMICMISWSAQ